MSVSAAANARLDTLRRTTAAQSDASTVSGISTAGHAATAAIFADGLATAATAGTVALKCFARTVAMPVAAAMAGAWVAEKLHLDDKLLKLAEPLGARPLAKVGRRAAHIEHQIAHSNAFRGAIAGLLVGAAVVGGAILIVGTGGLAAAPL
ncbi:hypothetical protein, partial [Sphingomonas bacterium]|uniref:hypothetical protein n=1 Tax=Sphingomonas bacterium TaxID=1895847 RepID=UPI00157597C9